LCDDSLVGDESERRLASNEATFRDVNEAIARGQWPGERDAPLAFRCECARLGCDQMIEVPAHAYERVRSNSRRFLVAQGHEMPEIETVVDVGPGYVVVEKLQAAGEVADATDPRD
jgi:hypothetical protein